MQYQNYLLDAINEVLTWDIPDEALVDAAKSQAGLMARMNPEEIMELSSD